MLPRQLIVPVDRFCSAVFDEFRVRISLNVPHKLADMVGE